jgi:hypothetical protein
MFFPCYSVNITAYPQHHDSHRFVCSASNTHSATTPCLTERLTTLALGATSCAAIAAAAQWHSMPQFSACCARLKQHTGKPDEPVLARLREIAYLHAELPTKEHGVIVQLYQVGCWETAAWDAKPSCYITQLWKLNTNSEMLQQEQPLHPEGMLQLLDC